MPPLISVVIPTCMRPVALQRCLDALAQQTLDPSHWELIVVDDGHADAARLQVRKFAERLGACCRPRDAQTVGDAPPARTADTPSVSTLYLRPQGRQRGPAAARNCGWRAARGQIIAFTDDHAVPDRDWLRQGLHAMAHGQPAVRGRIDPGMGDAHERGAANPAEAVTPALANCFVRRDALVELGGFDERFLRAGREDSDLHFRLLRRYGTVPLAPLARVRMADDETPWHASLGQAANAMFDALLFKKHPELYRATFGRVHAPWAHYAIVFGTLAGAVAALLDEPGWSAVFATIVLGLVGHFVQRRLGGGRHRPARVVQTWLTGFAIPFVSLYWRVAGAVRFKVPFF